MFAENVYHVRPLEYNTPVWSPYLVGEITKIEKVQRNFTRRLPGLGDLDYSQRLETLGLETLEGRRPRFDLIEAFKITKGFLVLEFADFFQFKADRRSRGHQYQQRLISIPRLDVCKYFFS